MKQKFPFRRRMLVAASVAILVLLAAAVYASAGHETGAVASYTGCLNTSGGTVYNLKLGNDPIKNCNSNHPLVHLSGGDITEVAAGEGLTGGGSEGATSLAVDESTIVTGITPGFGLTGGGSGGDVNLAVDPTAVQKRVLNTCNVLDGTSIAEIEESGVTVCTKGPLALGGEKSFGAEVAETLFDPSAAIGSLFLTAGDYLVIARVNVSASDPLAPLNDHLVVDCELGNDLAEAGSDVEGEIGEKPGVALTMMAVGTFPTGNVVVKCADYASADDTEAQLEWERLRIVAIRLDKFQDVPLG